MRIRHRLGKQDGAAAVEFAIISTLFFMLAFAVIDFGFGFHDWINATQAAREGARRGAIDSSTTNIRNRVLSTSAGLDPAKETIIIQCSAGGGAFGPCGSTWAEGDIVRVTVDYHYDLITPLGAFVPGLGDHLTLHTMSESRYEGEG